MKILLGLTIFALVSLFFIGCNLPTIIPGISTPTPTTVPPTATPTETPAVTGNMVSYLYLNSFDGVHGNIYIDGVYKGYLPPKGILNLYNLTVGNHVLTIDTLPNAHPTINVVQNGQDIYMNWQGQVW